MTFNRKKMRKELMIQQGGRCAYCGRYMVMVKTSPRFATFDHVVPASKGGRWGDHNIVLACWLCNQYKGDRIIWRLKYTINRTGESPGR